jgi:HK97 family phage major capsid protein
MEAEYQDLELKIENLEKLAKREAILSEGVRQPLFGGKSEDKITKDDIVKADYEARVFPLLMTRGYERLSDADKGVVAQYRAVLNVTTPAEGGYLVPVSYQTRILEKLRELDVMRGLATNIRTSSTELIPVEGNDATFAWLDESAPYGQTDVSFDQLSIAAYKAGGIIKVSEEFLADAFVNVEEYLTKKIAMAMATLQEQAFLSGNGTKKPTGVLVTAELGVTSASTSAITMNEMLDLIYSVKQGYDKTLLMHSSTELALRKLTDTNGQYLWQPSLVVGTPSSFDGKPIVTSQYMPTIAASAKAIAFGDFSQYTIADRGVMAVQRLNELYAANGQIGWRANARVDGKLLVAEAVKTLTIKA